MDSKRRRAWKETLMLWKRLSETPSELLMDGRVSVIFKNSILNELGIESKKHGCPFCEEYYGTANCPLGSCLGSSISCYNTPYGDWEKDVHNQQKAKVFYEYLLELYKKELRDEEKLEAEKGDE